MSEKETGSVSAKPTNKYHLKSIKMPVTQFNISRRNYLNYCSHHFCFPCLLLYKRFMGPTCFNPLTSGKGGEGRQEVWEHYGNRGRRETFHVEPSPHSPTISGWNSCMWKCATRKEALCCRKANKWTTRMSWKRFITLSKKKNPTIKNKAQKCKKKPTTKHKRNITPQQQQYKNQPQEPTQN